MIDPRHAIIEWLASCVDEAVADGYQQTEYSDVEWRIDGEPPSIVSSSGISMIVRHPSGKLYKVTATNIQQPEP